MRLKSSRLIPMRSWSSAEDQQPRWSDYSSTPLPSARTNERGCCERRSAPRVFAGTDFRNHHQHFDGIDAPKSFLRCSDFWAASDRQLRFHGAIHLSAGIPNPERYLARCDVDLQFV